MINDAKLIALKNLSRSLTNEERLWASGYLAGQCEPITGSPGQEENNVSQIGTSKSNSTANSKDNPLANPETTLTATGIQADSKSRITFAYATETGNSRKLASEFTSRAKTKGLHARLVNLEQYRFQELLKEEFLFTVISTQGEGELPVSAQKFFSKLQDPQSPNLESLKFSVLALGDSSYPQFCRAGESLHERLDELGARQVVSLRRCDLDYDEEANEWFDEVLKSISVPQNSEKSQETTASQQAPASQQATISQEIQSIDLQTPEIQASPRKSKKKTIYTGKVNSSIKLNDVDSTKHTRHIEISVPDVQYQPGDSLGIIPSNPVERVSSILSLTGTQGDKVHAHSRASADLHTLLHRHLNIMHLSEQVVRKYAQHTGHDIPDTRIGLLDLLKIYPISTPSQFEEVIHLLEGITPRLYSIASSPQAHPDEIHLTVARDVYSTNDEEKFGLCSDYLIGINENEAMEFYIHANNSFRLPESEQDLIMIGPGTGIAPFRSFLWEREASGAEGRNWLFFGDRNFSSDFLYQTELQNFHETGVLTRINTAFSRDQGEKRYVQHRIIEQGAELVNWINNGASIYICGAREPMSLDVEQAFIGIFERFNKNENAKAKLDELKESGRFHKDVY